MHLSPWSSFPFARITLVFTSGLLAARYWAGPAWIAAGLLGLLLLIYVFFIVSTPLTSFHAWRHRLGLLGLGGIFLLGYLRWLTHEVRYDPMKIDKY